MHFMGATHTHSPFTGTTSRTGPYIDQDPQFEQYTFLEPLLGCSISACSVWWFGANHRGGSLGWVRLGTSRQQAQRQVRHAARQPDWWNRRENYEMISTPTESMNARHGMDSCMLVILD
jgi:hypothetical protein